VVRATAIAPKPIAKASTALLTNNVGGVTARSAPGATDCFITSNGGGDEADPDRPRSRRSAQPYLDLRTPADRALPF
jgi:hypothetical protein